jgi:hypothetical protein
MMVAEIPDHNFAKMETARTCGGKYFERMIPVEECP